VNGYVFTVPAYWFGQADSQPITNTSKPEPVRVIRVIDGDTIVVSQAGKSVRVRLIGVDCPEAGGRGKPVEWFANESSAYVRSLLDGRSVYLEFDPTGNKIDRYGRTLAHVYRVPDRLWINREIVSRGYGFALTRYPFAYLDEFRQAERSAREAGRGLWGTGKGAELKRVPSAEIETAKPIRTGQRVRMRKAGRGFDRTAITLAKESGPSRPGRRSDGSLCPKLGP
jgi:micrococcal nuclease